MDIKEHYQREVDRVSKWLPWAWIPCIHQQATLEGSLIRNPG